MNLERVTKLRAAEREWRVMCLSGYSATYTPRPLGRVFAASIFAFVALAFFCALSACGVVAILETFAAYVLTFLGAKP